MSDGLSALLAERRIRAGDLLSGVLVMTAWVFVYFVLTLGVWVSLSMLATGWEPVVVTGGSMTPTIRSGDVLLIEDHPEDALVGQRAVITYLPSNSDGLVTHRVFEVDLDAGAYVTKGDANVVPDVEPITPDQVQGVARLVVPLLGLPIVWLKSGQYPALVALGAVVLAALYLILFFNRNQRDGPSSGLRSSAPAILGIRRARLLVAILVSFQFVFQLEREEITALGLGNYELLALTIIGLGSADLLARRGFKTDADSSNRLALLALGIDTIVVVGLVIATGQSRVGWLLMALPLVEASVHFRLVGALNHWMIMTGVILTGRMFVMSRSGVPVGEVITELEQLLDQLGALLLVAIPGAFLAEQLVGDIASQRDATRQAVGRGLLLGEVSQIGREINRLGSDLFDTLTGSALGLGFDVADVWQRGPDGTWQRVSERIDERCQPLPSPWDRGSGMRPNDLEHEAVIVDPKDPDDEDYGALTARGYRQLVRFTLVDPEDETWSEVAVRVAKLADTEPIPGSVEAYQLLVAQAVVALQNSHLVDALHLLNEQMDHRANHDLLTGLPNRGHFLERLQQTLNNVDSDRLDPAVLFCDLDGFKQVNDTLGHAAGDQLLVEVSQRLTETVGSEGIVARLGGDEFTVLLPVADSGVARAAASRIHAALRTPFDLSGRRAEVGTSVGIAVYQPGLGSEELLRRADSAMYAAKRDRSGTNTAFYNPTLEASGTEEGRIAADLRRALADHSLMMWYQPVVGRHGSVIGVEALLRWDHPQLGMVGAEKILDWAAGADLIEDLNYWTFATALGEVAEMGLHEDVPFHVALNVAATELEHGVVPLNLDHALDATGFPSNRVLLQMPEQEILTLDESLIRSALVDDVRLSVQEFGRDPGLMERWQRLPIESVTLFPLLVQRAARSDEARAELDAVVASARSFARLVVAAGIEEGSHSATAVSAGASALQGFGLYRPLPVADLWQVLRSQGLVEDRRSATDWTVIESVADAAQSGLGR